MSPDFLSRVQFALTASFHFIFPPLSIGLGLFLVVIGVLYLRTRNPKWRQLSFYWVRIYGLVFALGVATGIVQEFEFGTNWSVYSRFVGNIFGSLLAAEGIFAFFLEGGFLGLMLFGGTRLGPRLWLLATALVALGAHFSAIWIVMANSWMQTPTGYTVEQTAVGPMAFMTSFAEVLAMPSFMARIMHTFVASWMVGLSLVLSVSAYYLLRDRHTELARSAMRVALPIFVVLSFTQALYFGPEQAVAVTEHQPAKLAALEGLWESTSCAPLYLVGWVDEASQTTVGLAVPCLLSFLATGDFNAVIQGLRAFPPDTWAPVNLVFQVYHIMINLGGVFVAIGLLGAFFYFWRQRLFHTRWLLWVFVATIGLTELATLSGWWTAEFGRQPWIVWELLRTTAAVSPNIDTIQVLLSNLMFVVLYIILFTLFLYLLNEKIQHGPDPLEQLEGKPVSSLPDTFRDVFSRRARA